MNDKDKHLKNYIQKVINRVVTKLFPNENKENPIDSPLWEILIGLYEDINSLREATLKIEALSVCMKNKEYFYEVILISDTAATRKEKIGKYEKEVHFRKIVQFSEV